MYSLEDKGREQIWLPHALVSYRDLVLAARTSGEPLALAAAARTAIHAVDPGQPIIAISTMRAAIGDSLAQRRLVLILVGGFAAAALLLTGLGVYGVASTTVAQRTRELGIRMALGADRGRVVREVLSGPARLVAFGLFLGLAGTWPAGRAVQRMLYGVRPMDPLVLGGVRMLLLVAAGLFFGRPADGSTRARRGQHAAARGGGPGGLPAGTPGHTRGSDDRPQSGVTRGRRARPPPAGPIRWLPPLLLTDNRAWRILLLSANRSDGAPGPQARPRAGHARPHRAQAPSGRPGQRLGSHQRDPGHDPGRARRQLRLHLPRSPPPRGPRIRGRPVGRFGEQPAGPLLRAHRRRPEAARRRAPRVGPVHPGPRSDPRVALSRVDPVTVVPSLLAPAPEPPPPRPRRRRHGGRAPVSLRV